MGVVAVIQNLSLVGIESILLMVVSFLLFTWLITSLDSATLVICHILQVDHIAWVKVFWGFILGGITCVLMLIGGISTLQAASIIIGLPLAFVILLIAASLMKAIFIDLAV
ncbi:MAG: BCCT family transporter [bacterium]|nr:hypothetical protein [Gammaproteobacteria bacterium]HIL94999.1 hypothetical protein [Pseudomonadales bacterium]